MGGRYRVLRVLGEGGMGVVIEAEHVGLRQRVALKFLHPATADLAVPVTRLMREARAASAIRSEHVVRVLDVGVLESGAPYIAMEYLVGADLRGLLGRRGPLAVEDAVDYILQACVALAEAHSLGIVHRDIKPSNLFLTKRADGSPLIKLLDFGIAKVLRGELARAPEDAITLTDHGLVIGSPRYTPPERLRDPSIVDQRTDIWAIGIVLHELLTGVSPFEAKTTFSLYYKIAADPPTPLCEARPDAPAGLAGVILRCLEKDPDQRFADVAELAEALRPYAPERSQISVARVLGIGASQPYLRRLLTDEATPNVGLRVTNPTPTRTELPGARRSPALGVVAGGMLVAGAFTGAIALRELEPTGGAPPALNATLLAQASDMSAEPEVKALAPAEVDAGAVSAGEASERVKVKAKTEAARGKAAVMPGTSASASRRRAIMPKAFSRAGEVRAVDPLGDRE